jgi:purine-binding chemotaxis protein CheW
MDVFKRMNKQQDDEAKAEGAVVQIVTFRLGNAEYGIDIMQAKEIIKMEKITLIPNAPEYVEGVINLRGNVIPIIDLKKRFHLEEGEGEQDTGIIIVRVENVEMGIIIDSISKVISIPEDDVQPPPPVFAGIGQKYIQGVARLEDRLLIILDLQKLFAFEEEVREV